MGFQSFDSSHDIDPFQSLDLYSHPNGVFSLPLIKITIAKTQARLSQNALGWSTVLDKHYCVKTSSGDRVRIPTML